MSSKARKASSGQSSSSNRFRFCGFRVRSSSFIQTNRNGAVALTPENGEMQQPSCFSEPTAVLFLLYRGEKGPKRGTLSVSWVFRGLRTSGQGVAPTPHHLLKKVDENFWDYLRQPVFQAIRSIGKIRTAPFMRRCPNDGVSVSRAGSCGLWTRETPPGLHALSKAVRRGKRSRRM